MNDEIIGTIELAFEADINHEYHYEVFKDGRILPLYIKDDIYRDPTLFFRELADPTLGHILFISNSGKKRLGVDGNMDWLEAYDILLWSLGIPVPDDDENRFLTI